MDLSELKELKIQKEKEFHKLSLENDEKLDSKYKELQSNICYYGGKV